MSVTIRHLNADSTFLLNFSPLEGNLSLTDLTTSYRAYNGVYSILIDPWLNGDSVVTAPWFAVTKHNIPPCIQHLSEIEEPDLVIVSQNKPDHCHAATLRQLRPQGKTIIAAEPGAAKVIKKWKHFDPARVFALQKYEPHKKFPSLRFHLPPLSPEGHAGEVTVSYIPARNNVTGLHNAIGITYRPPTHFRSVASVATMDLPRVTKYFHMPLSPASLPPVGPPPPASLLAKPRTVSPEATSLSFTGGRRASGSAGYRARYSRTSAATWSDPDTRKQPNIVPESSAAIFEHSTTHPPRSAPSSTNSIKEMSLNFELDSRYEAQALPTPPESPSLSSSPPTPHHHTPTASALPTAQLRNVTPGRPRPVSVLYSPHGVPFKDLIPYAQHHLVRLGALPLTLLLHSFHRYDNPIYLGGNVLAGSPGGLEIAQGLMARCWLSAHDEVKDDRGIAVQKLKITRTSQEAITKILWAEKDVQSPRSKAWLCNVRDLPVGEEMTVGPASDLFPAAED